LLEHQESVEHQVERDVLAIAEVEHLNVVQSDGAAVGEMSPIGP
jgi:hypothetical protein